MSNNKLSLQLNIDDFLPASDEEKESLTVLRKSVGFWQDGIRRLMKNKIAMVSLVVIIFVFIFSVSKHKSRQIKKRFLSIDIYLEINILR